MMKTITFTIYGEPYGKKNMRPVRFANHLSSYSPKENHNYLNAVKMCYVEQAKDFRFDDGDQLTIKITAYKSIPKSISKKKLLKIECGLIKPITKPDCDNISKAICDGLNKLAFRDDSQITDLIVAKRYDKTPRVDVEITANNESEV